ncbi:MAG: response regulator [Bryobacterales bacterium]|nr:response regulator [Bryobacterales bacterium]
MSFRILIVDDEADLELLVRQRFRKKIRDGEFDFCFALNGQEALEKLQQDPSIDIVMSDINMPVMDGLTLLSRLSDINRLLKTVIVTAYGDMRNIRTAMNRGAYDFLTKPIDFVDFETTINKTVQELRGIREGQKASEQLKAIQNELSVATRIQQSILPRKFPAFPERADFDVYGAMIPAQEVGGDFYDFFLIDEARLGFAVGDVSGRGVASAIFMAACRTLLKATALQGVPAAECVKYVNSVMSKEKESAMFVTLVYGILDTATGEIEYCVGGHNPPYVFTGSASRAALDGPSGMIVGLFEDAEYEIGRVTLKPGDALLLYTDGVTEAQNKDGDGFHEERLEAVLERSGDKKVREIVDDLIGEVRGFTAGTPQSDDITVLALRYSG